MELSEKQFQELLDRTNSKMTTSETKLLEKIPGGAAGAVAGCALLVFFAKGWVDDKKLESEALVRIERSQELGNLKVEILTTDVKEIKDELKEGVKDRITKTTALEKFEFASEKVSSLKTELLSRIHKLETQLDYRGKEWMPEVDQRLQRLEMKISPSDSD